VSSPIFRRVLWSALLLLVAAAVWLLRPVATDDLVSAPDPAGSYEEAMARAEALRAREDALPLHEGGRTIVLSQGHRTYRVFVLLHGLTNSPRQFRELGEALFAAGANVIIPRLAQHGLADRMTEAHGALTAQDLVRYAESGIDLAQGLGDKVTVVGLSVSGTSAAWLAGQRDDLDEVFLLAPLFGPGVVPDALTPAVTASLVRLPNTFLWWDPKRRENLPGPPTNYPRFPTRGLGEALRLGMAATTPDRPLKVRRLGLILSETDIAVNNARTLRLVEQWRTDSPGTEFFVHTFPAAERVPHDFIDPLQPGARTQELNPLLVSWLMGHNE
jgi:pimeloyl-ACP methyl ester carboxylesterase